MTALAKTSLGKRLGDLVANAFVKLGENLVVEGGADRLDELDALFGPQKLDDVGKVGGFEIADERRRDRGLVATERFRNRPDQVGGRSSRIGTVGSGLDVAVFNQERCLCALAGRGDTIILRH